MLHQPEWTSRTAGELTSTHTRTYNFMQMDAALVQITPTTSNAPTPLNGIILNCNNKLPVIHLDSKRNSQKSEWLTIATHRIWMGVGVPCAVWFLWMSCYSDLCYSRSLPQRHLRASGGDSTSECKSEAPWFQRQQLCQLIFLNCVVLMQVQWHLKVSFSLDDKCVASVFWLFFLKHQSQRPFYNPKKEESHPGKCQGFFLLPVAKMKHEVVPTQIHKYHPFSLTQ